MAVKYASRQKKKTPPAEPQKETLLADSVTVDYPIEDELVMPGHYAVRISALPEAEVEVSISGGEWQTARSSMGFFWFDWWPAETGDATVAARARVGKGRWKKAADRHCRVTGSGSN
jgi:hypothetical protein